MKKMKEFSDFSLKFWFLAFVLFFSLFTHYGLSYSGEVVSKQMIDGKEYRVEKAEGGYWAYWGEDKVFWEPKPYYPKGLKEKGPAYFDMWLQPNLPRPFELSLAERDKLEDAREIMWRNLIDVIFAASSVDAITEDFWTLLYSPGGGTRRKKGHEWIKSYYLDPEALSPEDRGKVTRKYLWILSEPEDVSGMGGLGITYFGEKGDDLWFYLPATRKVRRMAVGSRQDFFPGTIHRYEDYTLPKPIHNYKIVNKELFKNPGPKFLGFGNPIDTKHKDHMQIERPVGIGEPCWVIESTPYREKWWFAKRLHFIGMKSLSLWHELAYDKTGRLIRGYQMAQSLCDPEMFPASYYWQTGPAQDFLTGYSCTSYVGKGHFNTGYPEEVFSTRVLLMEPKDVFFWKSWKR